MKRFKEYSGEMSDNVLFKIIDVTKKLVNNKEYVTSMMIVSAVNSRHNLKINGSHVRYAINYIRRNGIIKRLIASHQGYKIAVSKSELTDYLETLKYRADAILEVHEAMKIQ